MVNVKNYTEQGGDKTVIGGELNIKGRITFEEGAEISALPLSSAELVAESEASTVAALRDDVNSLIRALVSAGVILGDGEE